MRDCPGVAPSQLLARRPSSLCDAASNSQFSSLPVTINNIRCEIGNISVVEKKYLHDKGLQ